MRNLFFLILFLPSLCFGQISEGDTMQFQSRLSVTANWQTGNVELLAVRARWDITATLAPKVVFKTQNAFLYQEFYRAKVDQDFFSRNFLYFNPKGRFYSFGISHIITNFRRKIDFRYFVGLGMTWQAIRNKNHLIKLAVSGVYESTDFAKDVYNEDMYNGNRKITTCRATF